MIEETSSSKSSKATPPKTSQLSENLQKIKDLYLQLMLSPLKDSFSSIIIVQSLAFSGIQAVEMTLPVYKGIFTSMQTYDGVFNIPGFHPVSCSSLFSVQLIQKVIDAPPGLSGVKTKADWKKTIKKMMGEMEIVFVVGAKNSGKSTFARMLSNAAIER